MADTLRLLSVVVWHTAFVYLFLVIALALFGRALMAQFTLIEYLGIALLGSAVETTLYAGSSSLAAGLTSAATLLTVNRTLAYLLARSRRLRRLLSGTPIVLVEHGHLLPAQLRRAGLTSADVLSAIHERGYAGLDDVRWVVLEINGAVGVIPRTASEV